MDNSNEMLVQATCLWQDKEGAWLVLIEDTSNRSGEFYRVCACDEFIVPLAVMRFNGLDSLVDAIIKQSCNDDWSCELCENSEEAYQQLLAIVAED